MPVRPSDDACTLHLALVPTIVILHLSGLHTVLTGRGRHLSLWLLMWLGLPNKIFDDQLNLDFKLKNEYYYYGFHLYLLNISTLDIVDNGTQNRVHITINEEGSRAKAEAHQHLKSIYETGE